MFSKFCLVSVSIVVAILLAEGLAYFYVYSIAEKGRIFKIDENLGWDIQDNLDLERKNADGQIWTIKTDATGFRTIGKNVSGTKLLILGDSFAFGQGVDAEERFDSILLDRGYNVINTGVPAYGIDQAFIKSRPHFNLMGEGDIVVALVYFNDFYDLAHKRTFSRPKPWFTLKEGKLHQNMKNISLLDHLRYRSFLVGQFLKFIEIGYYVENERMIEVSKIFQKLIKRELESLNQKQVSLILAYHGVQTISENKIKHTISSTLKNICTHGRLTCLDIDRHFNLDQNGNYFLADGHWNEKGNKFVGELLLEKISNSHQ